MKPVLFLIICISLFFVGCESKTVIHPVTPVAAVPPCLPQVADSAKLSKDEVRELARCYDLIGHKWQANPHLEFQEGDISYWTEQGLTKKQLGCEFESRQKALQDAETTGEKIRTQGDLSYKAKNFKTSNCT